MIDTTHGVVQSSQPVTLGSATATIRHLRHRHLHRLQQLARKLHQCHRRRATGDRRGLAEQWRHEQHRRRRQLHERAELAGLHLSTIFTNPVPSNQVNNSIGLTLGASVG